MNARVGESLKMGWEARMASSPGETPQPDWRRPPLVGFPAALDSMWGVAGPLLAGFSITFVGVIAQAPESFAASGLAMILLTISAVLFILCIQCGFWARQYLTSPAELLSWEVVIDDEKKREQSEEMEGYTAWASRASNSYRFAILVLLLGLSASLVPRAADAGFNAVFRWLAVAVALVMFIFEVFWMSAHLLHKIPVARKITPLRKVAAVWITPVREK